MTTRTLIMLLVYSVYVSWLSISTTYQEVVVDCNENICASIVTKCLITQACSCDVENCTCCRDCFDCLSYFYNQCCSCFEICSKTEELLRHSNIPSYVEDLDTVVTGLFNALTNVEDKFERWDIVEYPISIEKLIEKSKTDSNLDLALTPYKEFYDADTGSNETVNCTVAFMTHCMTLQTCKDHCLAMGASSIRWFRDGCCECVGRLCINYGIDESRCKKCVLTEEQEKFLAEQMGDNEFGYDEEEADEELLEEGNENEQQDEEEDDTSIVDEKSKQLI